MNSIRAKWGALTPKQKRTIKRSIGIVLGATAGFTYYATVGCASGGCPITSNPWISTGWGALIGLTATY
ncbi:MAG: hypothetical protein JXX29_08785 [Deltaproteobacteria bacterium]|nr:hypothetical protein [Deltaproteobacteria bacterium]MBN2671756.1 hypothetical protein [Deltaproteobacteria bacterium]